MKYIFYTLLLVFSLYANEQVIENIDNDLVSEESSVFDTNNSEAIQKLEIDYFKEISLDQNLSLSLEQNLYLSYKKFPTKIFKNQRFEIIIKAIVTLDEYDKIETRFLNSENMDVLNADSNWVEIEDKTFENKFFFKAYENSFVIPTFQVILYQNDEIIEVQKISPQEVSFSEIGKNINNFSSVIAKDLVINAHKTKQYNNDELITILDINAIESNLEDFHIKDVVEQGISKIEDIYPEQNLLYYLVLPVHTKKIDFSYYDSDDKKFTTIKIPIVLENELVSTQTDLNPNKSNILFYKKVGLGILFILFLLIYFWKKRKIYLILTLLSLVVFLIYMIPNKTKVLKKDSYIYILPTKKSTIFQKTNKEYMVEVSIKRGEFIKIIFNLDGNTMIGWVKENDFIKN